LKGRGTMGNDKSKRGSMSSPELIKKRRCNPGEEKEWKMEAG